MAQDKDGLVGLGNDLPWRGDPDTKWDMQFFKATTTGHAIIMGYKTYESMGKPLKNRINVVIDTHAKEFSDTYISIDVKFQSSSFTNLSDDVFYVAGSLQSALQFLDLVLPTADIYTHTDGHFDREQVFLIGGAKTIIRAILDNDLGGMYITTFNKSWLSEMGDPVYLDLSDIEVVHSDMLEEHDNGRIDFILFGES